MQNHVMAAAAATLPLLASAQSASTPQPFVEQQRQQERERALREQNERTVDQRPQAVPPAPAQRIPESESPCFRIDRVLLVGEQSEAFQWVVADLSGPDGNDSPMGRCLGTAGANVVLARAQQAVIARGYVTTRVLAVPQDLSTGTLTLSLVPGRIAAIRSAVHTEGRHEVHGPLRCSEPAVRTHHHGEQPNARARSIQISCLLSHAGRNPLTKFQPLLSCASPPFFSPLPHLLSCRPSGPNRNRHRSAAASSSKNRASTCVLRAVARFSMTPTCCASIGALIFALTDDYAEQVELTHTVPEGLSIEYPLSKQGEKVVKITGGCLPESKDGAEVARVCNFHWGKYQVVRDQRFEFQ